VRIPHPGKEAVERLPKGAPQPLWVAPLDLGQQVDELAGRLEGWKARRLESLLLVCSQDSAMVGRGLGLPSSRT
jgi:hypothetical protein